VRLVSIKNLADTDVQSPLIFNTLIDGLQDRVNDVRRYACLGLQRYSGSEAIDAVVKVLQTDSDSAIRALAADSLSSMEDSRAFVALVTALRREPAEDAKLAVVRALGKRRGWQTEAILQESLQGADWENMPVFTWACIRSLGQVAGTERSRGLLQELKPKVTNPIILSAIDMATRRISERIDELQQMERQLEEATPLTVAIPSEYDEEVVLPEEEILPERDLHTYHEESDRQPVGSAHLNQPAILQGIPRVPRVLKLPFEKN
jgi:HEAT repeat protein